MNRKFGCFRLPATFLLLPGILKSNDAGILLLVSDMTSHKQHSSRWDYGEYTASWCRLTANTPETPTNEVDACPASVNAAQATSSNQFMVGGDECLCHQHLLCQCSEMEQGEDKKSVVKSPLQTKRIRCMTMYLAFSFCFTLFPTYTKTRKYCFSAVWQFPSSDRIIKLQ